MSISGLCVFSTITRKFETIPLTHVEIDATIKDLAGQVSITQHYVNTSDQTLTECIYKFPLDESSSIFSFSAVLNGVKITGSILPKEQAKATYNAALVQHKATMLMEEKAENIFECRIGNLPPHATCAITLIYITELDMTGRQSQLVLPMHLAPRYIPSYTASASSIGQKVSNNLQCSNCLSTPIIGDYSRVLPDKIICGNCQEKKIIVHPNITCDNCQQTPIQGSRYKCTECNDFDLCETCENNNQITDVNFSHITHNRNHNMIKFREPGTLPIVQESKQVIELSPNIQIKYHILMGSKIVSVTSPTHSTLLTYSTTTSIPTVSAEYQLVNDGSKFPLTSDIILLVEQEDCFKPRTILEIDPISKKGALLLSVIPPPLTSVAESTQLTGEFIFILDCSGSMEGNSIQALKKCMYILIRSLPMNCKFNIIKFGFTFNALFPDESQMYNENSLNQATKLIDQLQADLGGTEIFRPLEFVFSKNNTVPKQIFLLTDGQVSSVDQVVYLVQKYANISRVFTFGIGDQVDRSLCKRLAQAGNGKAEFISSDNNNNNNTFSSIVIKQLSLALQPMITNIQIDWGIFANNNNTFLACPHRPNAIFAGIRSNIYALNITIPDWLYTKEEELGIKDNEKNAIIRITATSTIPNSPNLNIDIKVTSDNISFGNTINRLAARTRIRELEQIQENQIQINKQIEELALQYQLMSRVTSFVIVDENKQNQLANIRSNLDELATNLSSNFSLPPACAAMSFSMPNTRGRSIQFESLQCLSTKSASLDGSTMSFQGASSRSNIGQRIMTSIKSILPFNQGKSRSGVDLHGDDMDVEDEEEEEDCEKEEDETTNSIDYFTKLIKLSNISGIWKLNEELIQILQYYSPSTKFDLNLVKNLINAKKLLDDTSVSGTLLALLILEKYCMDRKSEWQLLSNKSFFWLDNTMKLSQESQKLMKETINQYI